MKPNDNNVILTIEKSLTIADVSALKDDIMKHMPSAESLTINLQRVEAMDIAGLQLLCAANRSFQKQKKRFEVDTGDNTDFFKNLNIQAGYDKNGSCHESSCARCLWKGDD